MKTFVGKLMTFDNKSEDEIIDEEVMVEVTLVRSDGVIEIVFDDRNERCYLHLPIATLLAHAFKMVGEKPPGE